MNSGDAAQSLNRTAEVESALLLHPGVREAVVVDSGVGIATFVVPDDEYLDDVLGRKAAETAALGKWRKVYDLTQFAKEAASVPVGFNTLGWNSTYTRRAIPANEMHEWLQTTVTAILRLRPKSVYEIGCGTGMLLMQIAPNCSKYVAVDFAPAVLAKLREQLQALPAVTNCVEVIERRADDFENLEPDSFDTVVLNSTTQYFPHAAYLTRVLENAVNIVKPGGHIFVGDMRSLPLLALFSCSVELFQAADDLKIGELLERVKRRMQMEQQLVLSPAYFFALQRKLSKVSSVEIQPRWGHLDNEMSCYRYNAILHIGKREEVMRQVPFVDWTERELSLQDIHTIVHGHSEVIGIKRIRNARLEKDVRAFERLRTADVALTAGALRRECEEHCRIGVHPQDLAEMFAGEPDIRVLLSWAACREDGSYDALFVRKQTEQGLCCANINWPGPNGSSFVNLANAPGQSKVRAELVDRIVAHCRQSLPKELVPGDITLVDMLPRTADGAVDRDNLFRSKFA